jgi:hypothetical protein
VLNAFLLPLVIGFLIALAVTALPKELRPRGPYLLAILGLSGVVMVAGLFGGISGLL